MSEYSCDSIQVLEGLEPVRKRPGMYIGDTGAAGLQHMLGELIANVIDLHVVGEASELKVELGPGTWITVRDDGPGIPTDPMPDTRGSHHSDAAITVLEAVCTRLHAGARFCRAHVGRSLFSAGLPVVNALSEQLVVETTHRGVRWTQAFERGTRVQPPRRIGPTSLEGTTIRFRADPTIFTTTTLDVDRVREWLQELAWLNPHLRVWFQEQRIDARGGIAGWAHLLACARGDIRGGDESVLASHVIALQTSEIRVDVALAWRAAGAPVIRSYANMRPTRAGTHVDGLWLGFRDHARSIRAPARTLAHVREGIGCGLVAVVHVQLDDVRYADFTRERLTSPEALVAVRAAVATSLRSCVYRTWAARPFVNARLGVDDAARGRRA